MKHDHSNGRSISTNHLPTERGAAPARRFGFWVLSLVCAGCGSASVELKIGEVRDDPAALEASLRSDPMSHLSHAEQLAGKLTHYRLTFYRQERLGLIPQLRPRERIAATFRVEPFSVKFVWLDEDSEYCEALFVRGAHDDRVLLLPRRGLFGMAPSVGRYPPELGVTFHKARNSITEFGLQRMIFRTIKRIENAEANGGVTVRYVGRRDVEDVPVYHIEILYPPDDPWPNNRQDLFLDVETGLPVGTSLWLPDDQLDATYLYLHCESPEAPFDDSAFMISDA
ncbi:MAG: DUF1571 domain-containing protein [Phycisphaerae bacterium]